MQVQPIYLIGENCCEFYYDDVIAERLMLRKLLTMWNNTVFITRIFTDLNVARLTIVLNSYSRTPLLICGKNDLVKLRKVWMGMLCGAFI